MAERTPLTQTCLIWGVGTPWEYIHDKEIAHLLDYDLVFVSGAECFGPASGEYTSFQGSRSTVIDYAICSRTLFPQIHAFAVEPRVPGFDNAALILQLKVDASILSPSAFPSKKRKRENVVLPEETELDRLLIRTMKVGKDKSKKALQLFGQVLFNTNPVVVTICGVCKNAGKHTAQAGASAYFGHDSGLTRAVRVWGNQTNARADLVALLLAIQAAPKTKTLHISTRSEYAIMSVKYYAYRNDACGWKCPNGDVLKLIIQWIKCRSAPLHFIHVKKGPPSAHYKESLSLAEKGSNLPRSNAPEPMNVPPALPSKSSL
ncbi:hypothetical protein B0H10DRAFT_1827009 [Mycena sp. CBHHK59/15]|nr:hypothetical protein B0H10DRAFT_1827009 [Mycena sp. CBHHK59/15]